MMYLCNTNKNNETKTNNLRHHLSLFAKKTTVYN